MAIDLSPNWTDRNAPAPLDLVQKFLNTPLDEPAEDDLRMADAIRRDAAAGDTQTALAVRYGVGQQLVSAVLRGARMVAAPGSEGGVVAAPTFGSPAATSRWLAANGFADVPTPTAAQHGRIRDLRQLLLALCLANNGEPLSADVPAALDRLAAHSPLVVRFDGASRPALTPAAAGVEGFVATVFASVYDAMRNGTWPRLKACPADRCNHVFYDSSRNGTSTWCSMAICGNRTKVRRYQERARATRRSQPPPSR